MDDADESALLLVAQPGASQSAQGSSVYVHVPVPATACWHRPAGQGGPALGRQLAVALLVHMEENSSYVQVLARNARQPGFRGSLFGCTLVSTISC